MAGLTLRRGEVRPACFHLDAHSKPADAAALMSTGDEAAAALSRLEVLGLGRVVRARKAHSVGVCDALTQTTPAAAHVRCG